MNSCLEKIILNRFFSYMLRAKEKLKPVSGWDSTLRSRTFVLVISLDNKKYVGQPLGGCLFRQGINPCSTFSSLILAHPYSRKKLFPIFNEPLSPA